MNNIISQELIKTWNLNIARSLQHTHANPTKVEVIALLLFWLGGKKPRGANVNVTFKENICFFPVRLLENHVLCSSPFYRYSNLEWFNAVFVCWYTCVCTWCCILKPMNKINWNFKTILYAFLLLQAGNITRLNIQLICHT